jgi:hypothetical protein
MDPDPIRHQCILAPAWPEANELLYHGNLRHYSYMVGNGE